MAVFLSSFYFLLGILILIIPLIYIELGRPNDLIKSGFILTIGMIVLVKGRIFNSLDYLILLLTSILIMFFVVEISFFRWNQLTAKERNKLITLVEFKKNIYLIFEANLLLMKNFLNFFNLNKLVQSNKNLIKKKWVRADDDGNISN